MIDRLLDDWAPFAAGVVVLAFAADWWLTHLGAAASRKIRHISASEGSYEMNPTWQAEVDAGQRFSWRAVRAGALTYGALVGMWVLTRPSGTSSLFFGLAFGAIALVQVPILMAHATNLRVYRLLGDPLAASGSIVFSRWFMYDQSTWYLVRWSVLWLVLGLASLQAVFFGGALGCFLFSRRLAAISSDLRAKATAPPSLDSAP